MFSGPYSSSELWSWIFLLFGIVGYLPEPENLSAKELVAETKTSEK